MAAKAPDPREFQTWEDAFQYPIPVVRKLEQQLRNNADENREKLRSLVGMSYRNLLDTAETIIDMESRMGQVESKLSTVGRSCNSRGLERLSGNTAKMDIQLRSRDVERYTFASQLSILRNAPVVMLRLMKKGGSYLLIAKLLVITRLLHKSLSQSESKPPIVDQQWEKLVSARRKLLRRIDKRLASTTNETADLVESMCAYALVTSSTPTDVLNHFLKVRLDKVNSELRQSGDELAKHGITALKLCIQTCLDTQTIVPRRLAEALLKLKAQPLIQDTEVRALYELNLDVHDRWIGDEARNYTPWPRHDELQRSDAEKILHRWSKDAIDAFLKGVNRAMQGEDRLNEVASLRQDLIETWILSGSRMAGVKSSNVLYDLRDTMNEKLESIVRERTQSLKSVVTGVAARLEDIDASTSKDSPSLWNTTDKATNLSNGAHIFKTSTLNTYHGRSAPVTKITTAFDDWMKSVLEVKAIIKSMKEARWDDTFTDDLDNSDSESDLEESKQTMLSSDDPRLLEDATQEALGSALQSLSKSFASIVSSSSQGDTGDSFTPVQNATFLLRIIREIGDRVPSLRLNDKSNPLASPFSPDTLSILYYSVAQHVVQPSTSAYASTLAASANARTPASTILWEGNPPLPTQPSPAAFRFLRDLNSRMSKLGADIWAPGCLIVLKGSVADAVGKALEAQIGVLSALSDKKKTSKKQDQSKGEGKADEDTSAEQENQNDGTTEPAAGPVDEAETEADPIAVQQRITQLLFDALYIQCFATPAESSSADKRVDLAEIVTKLAPAAQVEAMNDAAKTRLRKNAQDYARKTYLLFALLA